MDKSWRAVNIEYLDTLGYFAADILVKCCFECYDKDNVVYDKVT